MRKLTLALVPALFAALSACDSSTPSGPEPPAPSTLPDLAWLERNAVPFRTAEPGGDHSDLEPLREMIGDARVVALGEGTHGTREFFQMKHRLLEFLVREMGFTTFGIEATWAEANRINDYVLGGEGDPAVLLSNLHFWTWNTREVLDMIEWMRRHNRDPGGAPKIGFFGFDMQYSRVAMDDVEAFLRVVDPAAEDSVAGLYRCFRYFQDLPRRAMPDYGAAEPEVREECRRGVRAAHELLAAREADYAAAASPEEFARALRAARIVVQNEEMRGGDPSARDRYMAENAEWLLERAGPGGKIVLWAHNGHVADREGSMGSYLRRTFGEEMVVVGFAFNQGSFNAVEQAPGGSYQGLKVLSTPAAPERAYEHQFHRLGMPRLMVDLRDAPAGSWLHGPRSFRSIGSVYRPSDPRRYFRATPLTAEYDLMIYFETSSSTALLPFRYE